MPTRPVPFKEIERTVELWGDILSEGWPAVSVQGVPGAVGELTRRLGLSQSTRRAVMDRLSTAIALGIRVPEWGASDPLWCQEQVRRYTRYDDDYNRFRERGATPTSPGRKPSPAVPQRRSDAGRAPYTPPSDQDPAASRIRPSPTELSKKIVPSLRGGPCNFEQLRSRLGCDDQELWTALFLAQQVGAAIHVRDGVYHFEPTPAMGSQRDERRQIVSDKNGVIRFAAVGDTHLGSKYCRLDCLEDFYDHVAKREIPLVLHAGNWVDGEASFNRHDLLVHGMDPQMQYLAEHYPRRPGVECWAITGEDHEGWWARREGVDVGRYAENVMRHAGRTDWHDVGFMESFIDLVHGDTGKSCKLCLMHPGGGSAYAVSYAPQKIVEGFDGGDKPAVLLLGHYHKHSYNLIRNVHTFQVGCFEDQTIFMRQRKLAAHLGGWFIELELDPRTGACIQGGGFFRNYFVRDYYNGRWSEHGPVNHAPRSA